MRAAVTGGSGFIGSHVVDKLIDAGHDVVIIDSALPHRSDAEHHSIDILDLPSLTAAFAGCDTVFHLAGVADVNIARDDPVGTWETNVVGTARVWEAARRAGVRRTVLASTVWVYGAAVGDAPLDESASFALEAVDHVYTGSKMAAESVAHAAHALYGQEFTILRYGIPYGPRMRPALVIPRFVDAIVHGRPLKINGDGSLHRNYVYVEDLADAHVLAMDSTNGANRTFNLEGAEEVSLHALVNGLAKIMGPVDVEYGEGRPGDFEGRRVSADEAARELGWQPRVSFDDGLARTVDWCLTWQSANTTPATRPSTAGVLAAGRAAVAQLKPAVVAVSARRTEVVAGIVLALVLLPLMLGPATASVPARLGLIFAVAIGGAIAFFAGRAMPASTSSIVGVAGTAAVVWLLSQTASLVLVALLAVGLGGALALLLPSPVRVTATTALAALLTTASLAALSALGWTHFEAWCGFGLAIAAGLSAAPEFRHRPKRAPRRATVFATATAMFTLALAGWIGTTSASASWFGDQTSHGPRTSNRVALTFDTSLTAPGLPAVLADLDRQHVHATFFVTAGDVDHHRSAATALIAAQHTIAAGGGRRWLASLPGNRGVANAGPVFQRQLAVCPAFLRVPGNLHTPMLVAAAHRHGMRLIGADVSLGSPTSAAAAVRDALRAIDNARPGSIIDLHQSKGAADTLPRVLPLIVEGLRAKGLEPVSVGDLLDVAPYEKSC